MRSKPRLRWITGMTILMAGCATARHYPAPPLHSPEQLAETGNQSVEAGAGLSSFRNPRNTFVPRHVLVLSGGGAYGAYTAGVLKGWTESGSRPQFDVVTGISTGALIAPYAFLGSQYDSEIERLYTSVRREDIFALHLRLLDSIVSSGPLERQIATHATPDILRRIADAHRQGRRLYVGTTNLDTKQLVVWDMGAIAARNSAESGELFRKVLLASCAIPGILPPVPIDVEIDGQHYTELHVDGSVTACVLLQPAMLGVGRDGDFRPDAHLLSIRVIVAGKLRQMPVPTDSALFSIASDSMNTVFQAKTDGELTRLFLIARYAKADFKLAGIPQELEIPRACMLFDPQAMRSLFDVGYSNGGNGTAWQCFPPGLEKELIATPRSNTQFATVREASSPDSWSPDRIRIMLDDTRSAKAGGR